MIGMIGKRRSREVGGRKIRMRPKTHTRNPTKVCDTTCWRSMLLIIPTLGKSLARVLLELATEEAEENDSDRHDMHDKSPIRFLQIGFDLEEQQ